MTSSIEKPFDESCQACPRLAQFLTDVKAKYPDYYAKPVPAFGDRLSKLLIVGLAPGMHGANRTGRPFTGDYAGILLYQTLHKFGFASAPESIAADDGLRLMDCRITNAVRCLPPENKPVGAEVNQCNGFLRHDLAQLPIGGVVIALGSIAHKAVIKALGLKQASYAFGHGAQHQLDRGITLIDSYHCSRYNTQTKRLTESMFEDIFIAAKAAMDG